jgi:hypothetical protein
MFRLLHFLSPAPGPAEPNINKPDRDSSISFPLKKRRRRGKAVMVNSHISITALPFKGLGEN